MKLTADMLARIAQLSANTNIVSLMVGGINTHSESSVGKLTAWPIIFSNVD